jgi:GntR family transcriptional regulator, transcriptional repressor for pyruvate dehydrogenase complex
MNRVWTLSPATSPVISVDSTTASDNAAAWLKALVFTGQLGPGDRLPAERDLAVQLGIGRMTLRLALKSLETAGYIGTTRGAHGGSRVADIDALSAAWDDWMRRNALKVKEIFELRMILETQVASLAAQRATPDDVRRIEATLEEAGPNHESLIRWHTAFHDALGAATHNERLQRAVRELGSEIFLPVLQVHDEQRLVEIRALHQGILDAVRAGDAAQAERLMREHLEYTERTFFRAG